MTSETKKCTNVTATLDYETNQHLTRSASAHGRSKRVEALFVLRAFYRLPVNQQKEILSPE
ncbi:MULTISPECIES: TraY domain-containing protein [Vibrio]|uniref:Relaxosome protein TraY n=1 Tax=Vibrio tasmaniensis TaxID=212663 RepID=A0A0H3ZW89_9VIBR|nr:MULTISPECIES: TraY domain-containing protein [Vibrio]AKN38139.1 hypothetical protein [Vibrio tasmaniensis]MDE1315548.1 TraY domain-containing protein [Vibrio aestuarianus]PMM26313.1 hypothetical protein BCT58_08185 [Vibrio lentus]